MHEVILVSLMVILALGIGAQWLAWRLRLPSILLLLGLGILAGPGMRQVAGHWPSLARWIVSPDQVFGELFFPAMSLAVAVILFEGGLTLRFSDLKQVGGTLTRLLTIGAGITWLGASVAGILFLDLPLGVAVLVGAILIVTGPTVIGPLLRHIRPVGNTGKLLRWEGIVIDPIGATLAVLTFEAIVAGQDDPAVSIVLGGLGLTILVGVFFGVAAAWLLVLVVRRHWLAENLHNPVTLMLLVGAFTVSNLLQSESGLLTVTVMGIYLANQRAISIREILRFKENLQVLFISALFIILAARLRMEDLQQISWPVVGFVLALMLVVRPVSVWLATWRSPLKTRERLFLAWMAPRGIVAAAVASVFAFELRHAGVEGAERVVPVVFLTIIATVGVYGLTSPRVARWLGLADPDPQGLLLVGADPLTIAIAKQLHDLKIRVLLVDSNWEHLAPARMAGLPTTFANILSEFAKDNLELAGIGRMAAMTPNHEVNALAALHFLDLFGASSVYQLGPPPKQSQRPSASGRMLQSPSNGDRRESTPSERSKVSSNLQGRRLFGPDVTHESLLERFAQGHVVKKNALTEEFDVEALRARYGESFLPLFRVRPNGGVVPLLGGEDRLAVPGDTLISLVEDVDFPRNVEPAEESEA